ncbi:MAG: hypothetical protein KF763_08135 [Cyclobacteriaceae bacterium]|nr:hypothetical protein [Cyclobacteriaceae bacterium]
MAKIVFCYVALLSLLIPMSANAFAFSYKKKNTTACVPDFADEADEQTPIPAEEDTSEEDDDPVKLISHRVIHTHQKNICRQGHASQFLTSFHFLEIISPPPQQQAIYLSCCTHFF